MPVLYLSDADIEPLEFDAGDVRRAMRDAFAAYADGHILMAPKTSTVVSPGHAFFTMAAVDVPAGYAGMKWIGMVPPGGAAQRNINASLLLSSVASGEMLCLMDGRRATALRTAGMTAVAAQYLARPDSRAIGFVGAGIQAESHLLALRELIPSLRTVRVNSAGSSAAPRFVEFCAALGLTATVATPREVISESDIVLTSVPLRPDSVPFMEASWIRPGAFVAAIDMGRLWIHQGLDALELAVVDEEALKHYSKPGNFVPPMQHAQANLADLASGRHPGRMSDQERIIYFSTGSGVADLAISILIYQRALDAGVGTLLPN